MKSRSAALPLEDIKDGIGQIRRLLAGKTVDEVRDDRVAWAAFERFLEILSEASRHFPMTGRPSSRKFRGVRSRIWETGFVTSIATSIRKRSGISIVNDLDPLEAAIDAMLAAHSRKDHLA